MNNDEETDTPHALVTAETLLKKLFPEESDRPSLRWLRGLQAKRLIPYKKIGRLVFFDVAEVRAALDRQFTVLAK